MKYAIRCIITDLNWGDQHGYTPAHGWKNTQRGREYSPLQPYHFHPDLNTAYQVLAEIILSDHFYHIIEEYEEP